MALMHRSSNDWSDRGDADDVADDGAVTVSAESGINGFAESYQRNGARTDIAELKAYKTKKNGCELLATRSKGGDHGEVHSAN